MAENLRNERSGTTSTRDDSRHDDALEELRRLLIGPERKQLEEIRERLDSPRLRAQEVARVLPDSIILRSARDRSTARALEPIIEESIKVSVTRNPKALAEALFPVMGPAIRRAISSAIGGMVQSLNQIVEYSFSIQGLKWRLESIRTKRPFGEVVLLHTLLYQVEQVFLIHRKTGLAVQHVAATGVTAPHADSVSSMLTAIQDFVRDSFGVEKDEPLDTLHMGDRSVWVEQGPDAALAAVIRGNPPPDYRRLLGEATETIHLKQADALQAFNGDTTPFEVIRPDLEDCLQFQTREKPQKKPRKKPSLFWWLIPGALCLLIALWSYNSYRKHDRWVRYVQALDGKPGIVVTSAEKRNGAYHITGMRDPMAQDPAHSIKGSGLAAGDVSYDWEPYHSFYPGFVAKRVTATLKPPATVSLEFENGILEAAGEAPHRWIARARLLVETIPGVSAYKEGKLIDMDVREMQDLQAKLEGQALLLTSGSGPLSVEDRALLSGLAADMRRLLELSWSLQKNFRIRIVGHSTGPGTDEDLLIAGRKRAEDVIGYLVSQGLYADVFTAIGAGVERSPVSGDPNRKADTGAAIKIKIADGRFYR